MVLSIDTMTTRIVGLTKSEYLDFCQDFGGNTEWLANLQELPLELLVVWNQLSCECAERSGGDPSCCLNTNAHIPITVVLPSDRIIIEEQQFLREACLRTDQAIITYCSPPPEPTLPPLPPAVIVGAPGAAWKRGIIVAAAAVILACERVGLIES
jgi:hypothetical protein